MRSFQVFAGLSSEHAQKLFALLGEKAPAMMIQAVAAASAAMKARPVYLQRQPFDRRVQAIRRALSRVAANAMADEVLAVYFLECRKELLTEWLDLAGVAHKEGTLEENAPPQPADKKLRAAVESFRGSGDDPDRDLLLRAFAAQDAVEWPLLEALLAPAAAAEKPPATEAKPPKPAPRRSRKTR